MLPVVLVALGLEVVFVTVIIGLMITGVILINSTTVTPQGRISLEKLSAQMFTGKGWTMLTMGSGLFHMI